MLNTWTEILDQGGTLDAVYCDFMKVFDKVPHRRLLLKVEKYGITGKVLSWISSFLHSRTQCVMINKSSSEIRNVTSGIPQGSVLGPILFVLYINDLPETVSEGTWIFLFADDTKIFREIKSIDDKIVLQKDINSMVEWSEKWLLKFHPDKCVYMSVGNPNKFITPLSWFGEPYNMKGHPLSYSECEKDVGVHVDHDLKFDEHICTKINMANRIMGIAKKTFDRLEPTTFCDIFKGLIRHHLEYAAPVWSPHFAKQKEAIERVQRRATKVVPGLGHLSYPERLRALNLPTLAYRRIRGDMITVFKMINHENIGYDRSLPSLFSLSKTNHLRGHDLKLYTHQVDKDIGKFAFQNRIVKIWNSLPNHVVNSKDVISFEKHLDDFWKNQELLYDNCRAEINTY